MSYAGRLACLRCSTVVAEDAFMFGCPGCAAEGLNVNVLPVYDIGPGSWVPDETSPGMFRHAAMLPIPPGAEPVSLGEGRTPLLRLDRSAAAAGLEHLYLKDETRNPTWSYKDRLAAAATTRARAAGAETVVVATTGNHGAAVAAYAAAAGLRCVALTLASVPLTMKVLMQAYGARVVALEKGPDRWALMRDAVEARGWVPMSGLVDPPIGSNPFGVDGYKTIAYELFEDLGTVPDVVLVPTAYGDGLTGMYRGFVDLVDLGLAPATPRMVAVEPLGPFAAALAAGGEEPGRVESRPSAAFSIAGAVSTYQGVDTIRSSGGDAVVVREKDIVAAQLALGAAEGLYLEASSAIALPAAAAMASSGTIRPDETVVLIGTSTGLKDVGSTAAALEDVPVIPPDLAALESHLGGA